MTLNDVFLIVRIGYDEKGEVAAEIDCENRAVLLYPVLKDVAIGLINSLLLCIRSNLRHRDRVSWNTVSKDQKTLEVL